MGSIHKEQNKEYQQVSKKKVSKPNYLQLRLSMKVIIEKFPISRDTLDQIRRDFNEALVNL